jgi:hypothetical protein
MVLREQPDQLVQMGQMDLPEQPVLQEQPDLLVLLALQEPPVFLGMLRFITIKTLELA